MPKSMLKGTLILRLIKAEKDSLLCFAINTLLRITPVKNTYQRAAESLSDLTREGKLGAEDGHNMGRAVT